MRPFMERVKQNGKWTLFCPDRCPELANTHGDEFRKHYHYLEYEQGVGTEIEAQKLWFAILESQIETGTPYLLFKDAANNKSNQKILEQSSLVISAMRLLNIQIVNSLRSVT